MSNTSEAPLISVVIPVYNVEQYIEKCLDSITGQTYRNLEIIMVDDGSTDQSGAACDRIAKTDDRIRVIHQVNGGPSKARNTGIDHAKGQYLFFVDGDDYIAPDMIKELYRRLQTDRSDIALCGVSRVEADGVISREFTLPDDVITGLQSLEKAYGLNGVLFCSMIVNKLYRKKLFSNVRFPVGRFHEDEATVYKILDQCELISIVSNPSYYYLNREKSTMNLPYSVKQLDGIEASYQRYFYYKKKGGEYRKLLIPEGDLFTPLYFTSKQLFKPRTETEKDRVREIDRMAKEICFDQFFVWSIPRKIKLLSPYSYIRISNIKRKIKH